MAITSAPQVSIVSSTRVQYIEVSDKEDLTERTPVNSYTSSQFRVDVSQIREPMKSNASMMSALDSIIDKLKSGIRPEQILVHDSEKSSLDFEDDFWINLSAGNASY